MLTSPEATIAPNATSKLAQRIGRRYLFVFFIVPLLAFIFPFIADRFNLFPRFVESDWSRVLNYSYHTEKQDADIVLFGDSSALYDVDVVRLSEELHLKVINLPSTLGTLPVTRDEPLRRYLRYNRRPRLIVLHFAPWGLDAANHPNRFMFDGEEILLRNGSLREVLEFAWKKPVEVGQFPFRFYAALKSVRELVARHPPAPAEVVFGHLPFQGKKKLDGNCVIPDALLRERKFDFTRDLTQYASSQAETMVYLAPIPGCGHSGELASLEYPTLGASPPRILQASGFADDGLYVHAMPALISTSTDELADAIRNKLKLPE